METGTIQQWRTTIAWLSWELPIMAWLLRQQQACNHVHMGVRARDCLRHMLCYVRTRTYVHAQVALAMEPEEQPKSSSQQEKDDGLKARPAAGNHHKPKAAKMVASHVYVSAPSTRPFVSVAEDELVDCEIYMEDGSRRLASTQAANDEASRRLAALQMGSSARITEEDGRPSVQDSELASLHRPRKEMLKLPIQEVDPGNSVMVL